MRLRTFLAVALLAVSIPALALPAVQITIGGVPAEPANFVLNYDPARSPEFSMFGDGSVTLANQGVVDFNFSASGNIDPFFNWSFGISSLSATPATGSVIFSVPVVGGPYDRVTVSNLTATLGGTNPKATSITTGALLSTGGPLSPVLGSPWSLADCSSTPCTYASEVVAVPLDFYALMGASVQFTLEGGTVGQQASHFAQLGGTLTLDHTSSQVPEPAALLLAVSALAAMSIVLRLRRAR
jgi:hypothetical protein